MANLAVIVVLSAVLYLVIIPVLVALWLGRAKELEDAGKGRFERLVRRNWYSYALIVSVILYLVLYERVDRLSHRPIGGEELRLFSESEYDRELASDARTFPTPESRVQLLRKFEHAIYAWDHGDHARAAEVLRQLEDGVDAHGALPRLRSFVVANNLGVVTFALKRNKEFAAYRYFAEAKARVPPGSSPESIVVQNIERLDSLVNTLD